MAGGVRYLACVRPDKFGGIERDLGMLASEQLLIAFANIVRSLLGPHDIAGHFGGTTPDAAARARQSRATSRPGART